MQFIEAYAVAAAGGKIYRGESAYWIALLDVDPPRPAWFTQTKNGTIVHDLTFDAVDMAATDWETTPPKPAAP